MKMLDKLRCGTWLQSVTEGIDSIEIRTLPPMISVHFSIVIKEILIVIEPGSVKLTESMLMLVLAPAVMSMRLLLAMDMLLKSKLRNNTVLFAAALISKIR